MQYRLRPKSLLGIAVLLLATFSLTGCFDEPRELSIPPRTEPQDQANVGLGPGVRPLSSGPGEKSSPTWSPSGDRIAFIVDGYVADKAPGAQDFQRRTTKDFRAEMVAWTSSGDSLAILGTNSRSESAPGSSGSLALYETVPGEGSLEIVRLVTTAQTMASGPDGTWVLLALEKDSANRLVLVDSEGDVQRYSTDVEGDITGLSISPDGDQAILAVRNATTPYRYELYTFSLSEDSLRLMARLKTGLEILGAPQWTKQGIYYVAGEEQTDEEAAAPFDLYRVPPGSDAPESASGIGGDFVASNLQRDPRGERLAMVGRRNPGSPENLYVLDLSTKKFEAVTTNEDMEIKTGTEDLSWSSDGSSVVIVARAVLSEPKVYSAPADTLVADFYNLYQVPVGAATGTGME